MLLEIKNYLQKVNRASLDDLVQHFQKDPLVLQDMLENFIRKGQVCCKMLTPSCGVKCQQCPSSKTKVYYWN